jgi:hypothetical protein
MSNVHNRGGWPAGGCCRIQSQVFQSSREVARRVFLFGRISSQMDARPKRAPHRLLKARERSGEPYLHGAYALGSLHDSRGARVADVPVREARVLEVDRSTRGCHGLLKPLQAQQNASVRGGQREGAGGASSTMRLQQGVSGLRTWHHLVRFSAQLSVCPVVFQIDRQCGTAISVGVREPSKLACAVVRRGSF